VKPGLALAGLLLLAAAAQVAPITVTSEPLTAFQNLSPADRFGPFVWRGGLVLQSDDPKFGGLSGLVLGRNCEGLTAISDAGRWFTAELSYDGQMLAGLTARDLSPMLDSKGKSQRSKVWGDAEAVTEIAPGRLGVAYESRVRLGTYDVGRLGPKARFVHIHYPKDIDTGDDNGEIEALGRVPVGPDKGALLAISERHWDDEGRASAWLWRGGRVKRFAVAQLEDFEVTDLTILDDGTVLTLERSFSATALPGMAIRRFPVTEVADGKVITPEILFEGRVPFYAIDNMEGIAACRRDGETRITIISDNNFNTRLQRSLILQFAYQP
jgi:hypothetical protein